MDIGDLLKKIETAIVQPLISLLFAVAGVVFLWGIVMYVIGSQGDETKLARGKKVMLWGVIGLFIMASAWGIVQVLCNFFGNSCS